MKADERLHIDEDWEALDAARARALAVEINTERSRGRLPGPATLTAGQLLATGVLRAVARRIVASAETDGDAGSAKPDGPVASMPPTGPRRAARRPPRPVVDRVVLELVGPDPTGPVVRDLLAPEAATTPLEPTVLTLLRGLPASAPESLVGRLLWIREHWPQVLEPDLERRLVLAADIVAEEARALHLMATTRGVDGGVDGGVDRGLGRQAPAAGATAGAAPLDSMVGGGRGPTEVPDYRGLDAEPERFSDDTEWMPNVVLQAKSTYVWLDQLGRRYGREIATLDAVPDEELDRLADWGITGLWLIGVWQRSRASAEIKHRRGNPDAAASAYALDDYRIADDLGGEPAYENLRSRAAARGIRLASDMVPNHMGIDSSWVVEHPDWFLAVPSSPFPSYRFTGPDLSPDPRVEIRIEDHYWDATDAAVVFERTDRPTGERRYIYHGNDGTSFPWNDTAQLDYLRADVREAVTRAILDVARRFPIIRFDAAMVLARRHVRRLWWPEPGAGGGIPSRAEHALSGRAFSAAMPREFWREVVDRVAAEVPGTLLLAEAFWLMEGYFVRTLGMHRVYNSAFMHMLRDEDGAGYRKVIRETLAFDPGVLGRFVNFMTNPDEETALEQFGSGDKYFGVAMVLATMPGLPMLGHGQVEGLAERYGMEFRRAMRDEAPSQKVLERHRRLLVPLLRERRRFAGSNDFRLYDLVTPRGAVDEHVYAYTNGRGEDRSLVVYHDRFGSTAGRIRESVEFAATGPNDERRPTRETLADALGLPDDPALGVRFHDARTGATLISTVGEIRERGLEIRLDAYGQCAFTEISVG
jgi:glycosidase